MNFIVYVCILLYQIRCQENKIFTKQEQTTKYVIKNFYKSKAILPLKQYLNQNIIKIEKTKEFKNQIECKFQDTGYFYKKTEDIYKLENQQKILGYDNEKQFIIYADNNLHGYQLNLNEQNSAFHFQKTMNFEWKSDDIFYQKFLGGSKTNGYISLVIIGQNMLLLDISTGETLLQIKGNFSSNKNNQFFVISENRQKKLHYAIIYENITEKIHIYEINIEQKDFREFQIVELKKLLQNYGLNKKVQHMLFGQYFKENNLFVIYVSIQQNGVFSLFKQKNDQLFTIDQENIQFLECDKVLIGVNRFFFINHSNRDTKISIVRPYKYTAKLLVEQKISINKIPIDIYNIENYLIIQTKDQFYIIDTINIEKLNSDVILQDFYQLNTQVKTITFDFKVDRILDIKNDIIYTITENEGKENIVQIHKKEFQFIEANCNKRNQKNFYTKTYLDLYLADIQSNQRKLYSMEIEFKKKTMTFWDIITDFMITVILVISILIGLFFCMFLIKPKRSSEFYNTNYTQSIQLFFN